MNPERITGNLLEGMRFVADLYQDRKSQEGASCLAHVLDLSSLLWHQGEVRNVKVLLAGLLFHLRADETAEANRIFGSEVVQWALQAQQAADLAPRDFQRLQPAAQARLLQAGRQIFLAAACATIRQRPANQLTASERLQVQAWLTETRAYAQGFAGNEPTLEATLEAFTQTYQAELGAG